MWVELMQRVNPGFDLLVLDSFSDPFYRATIPALQNVEVITLPEGAPLPPLKPGLNWVDFPENMGSLEYNNIDGWGRAFCRGVQFAMDQGYDYAVNIEPDMLFGLPVAPILEDMQHHRLGALAPFAHQYGFMENTIMFLDVKYLKDIDYIGKYDWRARRKGRDKPENWCEEILGKELFFKNWHGKRDDCRDDDGVTFEQLLHMDYIMHAHDQELYYFFMMKYLGADWVPPSRRRTVA
jgi:hypothetical protein